MDLSAQETMTAAVALGWAIWREVSSLMHRRRTRRERAVAQEENAVMRQRLAEAEASARHARETIERMKIDARGVITVRPIEDGDAGR